MSIVPRERPQASRTEVLSFVIDGQLLPAFPFLVGRRGYFGDSMGKAGVNDLNVYDDALWLVEADRVTAWNANTDPGRLRPGMATLTPGRWQFEPGIHNRSKDPAKHPHYRALVQAAPMVVSREGTSLFGKGVVHPNYGECLGGGLWRGMFGVNCHCGGENVTSSEGCQTIPPVQWPTFMPTVDRALAKTGRTRLTYILTTRYGR